jgi:hypothetical protein
VRLVLLALLIAIAACAPRGRCDMSVTRDLAFSAADARETVTARVIGASCDKTIALYAIHDSEGFPVWTWTSPTARAFGDVFAANDREHVQQFLERWAAPTLSTTQHATEWRLLAPGQTTLDQLTYEDVRARNLPMLCHFSGTARETCVFWEPAAGGAGHLLDRDVEEADL